MNNSIATKTLVFIGIFLTTQALAGQWIQVDRADHTNSKIGEQIGELELSCEFLVSTFDKRSILAGCRENEITNPELGFYLLNNVGVSLSKNLLFKLGDASRLKQFEFHSPKTVSSHLDSRSKLKIEESLVLVDVKDESSCYATEVFELKTGAFTHIGSIEYSTLGHLIYPDEPGYETNVECLGKYGTVESVNGVPTLTFSASQIYRMDPNNGSLIQLKERELKYRWSSSKLTRIK